MLREISGNRRKFCASFLTTLFMSAVAAQAARQEMVDDPFDDKDDPGDAVCADDLNRHDLFEQTGYSDLEDVMLASAYATFMQQIGRNPTALQAILNASEDTGVDFELMVVKAMIESQLGKYDAPIGVNGSARGLFQFMPQTWLNLFGWFGADYNNGEYKELADAIQYDRNGQAYIVDKDIKQQILDLRSDHFVASYIKAMQLKEEEEPFLRKMLGRDPDPVDYYIIHFLGMPRAKLFYQKLEDTPNSSATKTFRREARYNRSVFYQNGKSRTYQGVYDRLDELIQDRIQDFRQVTKNVLRYEPCVPALQRDKPIPEAPSRRLPGFGIILSS